MGRTTWQCQEDLPLPQTDPSHSSFTVRPRMRYSFCLLSSLIAITLLQVDHYWEKLSAGGEEKRCGWLKDKYGVLWQVIPSPRFCKTYFSFFSFSMAIVLMYVQVIPKELGGLLQHPDKETREKAMRAMLQMKKIEVAKLTA